MFYSLYVFVFLLSFLLVVIIRQYSLSKSLLLDVPNARSAHSIPTPRGGGLSFVICFLISILFVWHHRFIESSFASALLASSVVALIGFVDDNYSLSSVLRLAVHLFVCALCVYLMGIIPGLSVHKIHLTSVVMLIVASLYLGWMLNLYNFMDGIDGLASIETISICLSGTALYGFNNNLQAAIPLLLLSAAVLGFLMLNFPPAKIFMGDVGSGFLGLVLGIFSLQAMQGSTHLFVCWLIIMGVFIVDASLTLAIRLLSRKNIMLAHSSHAYQHASRIYRSHAIVALTIAFINLVWLLPMALLVNSTKLPPLIGVLLAYTPLVIAAYTLRAGKEE